jgi:integrase/recombinase XerD
MTHFAVAVPAPYNASASSTQVYAHPDPARLRAAVDAVPGPRELAGVTG